MKTLNRSVRCVGSLCFLLVGGIPVSEAATVYSYNLSGDVDDASTYVSSGGTLEQTIRQVRLTDTLTGQQSLDGLTLNVGDTITGKIDLNNLFTFNASTQYAGLLIDLFGSAEFGSVLLGTSQIEMNEKISFFNNQIEVFPPEGLSEFGGSNGGFDLGMMALDATPSFTFNQIAFVASVTGVFDDAGNSILSRDLTPTNLSLMAITYQPSPVPLPAAAWLLGSGLLGLVRIGRRKIRK